MNLPSGGIRRYVGEILAEAKDPRIEVAIAPPFPFLDQVTAEIRDSGIALAAQNCSAFAEGAHTGEVSAGMLRTMGCRYTIVGHSERRARYGDTDTIVRDKLTAVISEQLVPVLCIGEEESVRLSGGTRPKLAQQLEAVRSERLMTAELILIAYEPVWAIGTGKNATTEMVAEAMQWIGEGIRKLWSEAMGERCRLLYGGSVTPDNASDLASVLLVEGFLVGGASLDARKLLAIHRAM